MTEIQLRLTINEVNSILQVLGKLPYEQVVGIINKISDQVREQISPPKPDA